MLPRARVSAAVKTLAAPSGTARFAAGKALCITAGKDPHRVYPYFHALSLLLESPSRIIQWNALHLLASLAPADADRRLDEILDRYLAFVRGPGLISAANAIQGAGQIARHRPNLLKRVIPVLLAVDRATFETPECRNVAVGQVLDALQALGPDVCRRPEVTRFVRRQRANKRAAVARRARLMLAGLESGGESRTGGRGPATPRRRRVYGPRLPGLVVKEHVR